MIDHFLESLDLIPAYTVLTFVGALTSICIMQITTHEDDEHKKTEDYSQTLIWVAYLRRLSWGIISLMFLWCLSYANTKGWQPWPPMVALLLALNFGFVIRIISYHLHVHGMLWRQRDAGVSHRHLHP